MLEHTPVIVKSSIYLMKTALNFQFLRSQLLFKLAARVNIVISLVANLRREWVSLKLATTITTLPAMDLQQLIITMLAKLRAMDLVS